MATKKDVTLILVRLAEAYGKEITEEQVQLYYQALHEYRRMVLLRAYDTLLKESKWFPRISEFVQAAEKDNRFAGTDAAKVDEQMYWYLFKRNLASTDELTQVDIQNIYTEAGVDMIEAK